MQSFIVSLIEMFEDELFQKQLFICHLVALYSLIASLITKNFSQVDRLWPILPAIYSWLFVYFQYSKDFIQTEAFYRTLIITILITSWSIRLTFNSWRRGYYKIGAEDYRWEHVKRALYYPQYKLPFHLFNFTFIAVFQNWLLFAITLPLWYIQKYFKNEPYNYFDLFLTLLFVIALLIETKADEQQWSFQSTKQIWLKDKVIPKSSEFTEDDLKRGFLTKGLFSYSRHPNFFAEMWIWWIVFGFSISSQLTYISLGYYDRILNCSIIGTCVLTLLFQGSTILTEKISVSKYPLYKEYQKTVSRFIPSVFSAFKDQKKE